MPTTTFVLGGGERGGYGVNSGRDEVEMYPYKLVSTYGGRSSSRLLTCCRTLCLSPGVVLLSSTFETRPSRDVDLHHIASPIFFISLVPPVGGKILLT